MVQRNKWRLSSTHMQAFLARTCREGGRPGVGLELIRRETGTFKNDTGFQFNLQ
jgi:hypothetical protein